MDQALNEQIVRRYIETVWNQGDLASVDELVATDYERVNEVLPGGRITGRQALKQVVAREREAFPDLRLTIDYLVADGDMVAVRLMAHGTHRGPLMGFIPTGKQFQSRDARFIQVVDRQIRVEYVIANAYHILQQLGIVLPLGELLRGTGSSH